LSDQNAAQSLVLREKVAQKFAQLLPTFKKLKKRQMGENSPHLVTLLGCRETAGYVQYTR
jgi:hypothetical protein